MKPIKSGASYFRRALKIKGSTVHSGRGFYELDYDCSPKELRARVDELVKKYPNRFNVATDNVGILVEIKAELMEAEYYYTLRLSGESLTIGM